MAYKSYKGWYSLTAPEKFVPPIDNYMGSFNESQQKVEYKSSLEQKSFKYCDCSDNISFWSAEPFPIMYVKPTDNKPHRYFVDLMIEFASGNKVIVEVKSSTETKPPKPPKKPNQRNLRHFKRAQKTWAINSAKWEAAIAFAEENGMKFMFLTEKQLNKIT